MPSCRSSGLLTENTQVFTGQCKLVSIHVVADDGSKVLVKVFDGTSNTDKEVCRVAVPANQSFEMDLHGIIMSKGIYYEEIKTGGNGDASTFINFA
jgi:hypothetical protein